MSAPIPRPDDAMAALLRDHEDKIKALQLKLAALTGRVAALEAAEEGEP